MVKSWSQGKKKKNIMGKKLSESNFSNKIKNQFKNKKVNRDSKTYDFLKKLLKQTNQKLLENLRRIL